MIFFILTITAVTFLTVPLEQNSSDQANVKKMLKDLGIDPQELK